MQDVQKIIDAQFDELVQTLRNTIRFNTEKASPAPNAPFGSQVKACLDFVLNTAKQFGLDTYDCDGYAGHVDFKGTGNEVLGILGHLDVVPSKAEEWRYPPYEGVIAEGKLFGRGTMDDKGPMIACLYAVKALKDAGFTPAKTVRLIFGCDEESGMECVEHYFTKMPFPTVSFSPDGDFPVINREKGIYHTNVVCGKLPDGVSIIAGDRANVVPSLCTATLPSDMAHSLQTNGVTISSSNGITTVTATGKSAHGSTPDEGINATHAVLAALHRAFPDNPALTFAATKLCDTSGGKWGIALNDSQSGSLTCNLGVLRTSPDGELVATMDIRFPVTYSCEDMHRILSENTPNGIQLTSGHCSQPLYVPADTELVSTLMEIYNAKMHTSLQPIAIGGGTYSRCLPNCVAFGPLFPNEEQTIHMPNECISLDNLKTMTYLYAEAIYRLACK